MYVCLCCRIDAFWLVQRRHEAGRLKACTRETNMLQLIHTCVLVSQELHLACTHTNLRKQVLTGAKLTGCLDPPAVHPAVQGPLRGTASPSNTHTTVCSLFVFNHLLQSITCCAPHCARPSARNKVSKSTATRTQSILERTSCCGGVWLEGPVCKKEVSWFIDCA